MNILIFTQNYPKNYNEAIISGMVKNPFYLSLALKKEGHHVTVITGGRHRDKWNFEGVDVYCVGRGILKGVIYAWVMEFKMFLKFLDLRKHTKFDVMRIHQLDLLPLVLLRRVGLINYPLIFTAHGTSTPELHASSQGNFLHYFFLRMNGVVHQFFDKIVWRMADKVIVTSMFQIKEMKEIYKVPEEKIVCIYNGVDDKRYYPNLNERKRLRQELKIPEEVPVVLYVGRIARKKGIHLLINNIKDILARVLDVRFVLVMGNIGRQLDYKREILELIRTENLGKHIIIKENVSERELPDYYNIADLCVFPSIGYESIPTVIYEAMASGKPIITQGSWGIVEVLENVLLTEDKISSDVLGQNIIEVLSNVELRERLKKDGLEKIKIFYWDEIAQKHLQLYKDVINKNYLCSKK